MNPYSLLLADVDPKSFWNGVNNSPELITKIVISMIVGFAILGLLVVAPSQIRKYVIAAVTFLSGLFYVAFYFYPVPIGRKPSDRPQNTAESIAFWIADAQPVVANFSNIIGGFLIGLGVYSLLHLHIRRIVRQQKDWGFSVVLLGSMLLIVICGYADWIMRQGPTGSALESQARWGIFNYGRDLLFDGLLQQMDAAMFSMVAFYILSAAYRAFRARSLEATILLIAALIVVLSLMGALEFVWNSGVNSVAHNDPNAFIQNFKLTEIAKWLQDTIQTPSIRGIEFGVGIGLLAMGLRIWLSLETTGSNS